MKVNQDFFEVLCAYIVQIVPSDVLFSSRLLRDLYIVQFLCERYDSGANNLHEIRFQEKELNKINETITTVGDGFCAIVRSLLLLQLRERVPLGINMAGHSEGMQAEERARLLFSVFDALCAKRNDLCLSQDDFWKANYSVYLTAVQGLSKL